MKVKTLRALLGNYDPETPVVLLDMFRNDLHHYQPIGDARIVHVEQVGEWEMIEDGDLSVLELY